MNRTANSVSNRLSLRRPQRESLDILHRVMELADPRDRRDPTEALAAIRQEFPTVEDFERTFPSICFALATATGKTRLMGAFIAYLHLEHGVRNFFVLAPNLTIYEKLLLEDPKNPYLRGRCEWLARLAMARARETRRVGQATPAASPRARTGTCPGWASEPPPPPKRADSIVPRRIVPVR